MAKKADDFYKHETRRCATCGTTKALRAFTPRTAGTCDMCRGGRMTKKLKKQKQNPGTIQEFVHMSRDQREEFLDLLEQLHDAL